LSIGGESEIKLWNLSAKEFDSRRILVGGLAMKFSPDDSLLATQEDKSGKISVWEWNARDPLLKGTASADYDFAFTSDNHLLIADSSGVFMERFNVSWALSHVCNIVHRNLTSDEQKKYLPPGFDYTLTCRL